MLNNLKKVTSAAVAGAVVLGSLALYPNGNKGTVRADAIKFDSASAINYATILGGAVDYGIVADTIYQNSHTETTFATNHFWHNVSNIDADYIDSPALFLIGEDLNTTDPDNNYNILFGNTRASAIFLEAPDAVFGPSVYDLMVKSTIKTIIRMFMQRRTYTMVIFGLLESILIKILFRPLMKMPTQM